MDSKTWTFEKIPEHQNQPNTFQKFMLIKLKQNSPKNLNFENGYQIISKYVNNNQRLSWNTINQNKSKPIFKR